MTKHNQYRFIFSLSFAFPIILFLLSACKENNKSSTPLPPELAAIECPTDQKYHASTLFGKAEITFVCISKQLKENPELLRCDLESSPMVCEDVGNMVFLRVEDKVYSGISQDFISEKFKAGLHVSRLHINFTNQAERMPALDTKETNWRFLLPRNEKILPSKFDFVAGIICDRASTVLETGGCNLSAKSPSLSWRFSIYIYHPKGQSISAEEYEKEWLFWSKYLDQIMIDPHKA